MNKLQAGHAIGGVRERESPKPLFHQAFSGRIGGRQRTRLFFGKIQ